MKTMINSCIQVFTALKRNDFIFINLYRIKYKKYVNVRFLADLFRRIFTITETRQINYLITVFFTLIGLHFKTYYLSF